ncbi:biorientation of chromosomes in cell division protein 1-like 1 [Neocloeon triangulifer]|uniref:biorientation of chromosomes in cell division protein 1-like 1 n=1 Tax=Neocloeon triangulifer TaxID=2078957 RepID=UPI00286EB6CC|nr:biorientation of chromosomes in cell division protein 1-like 1 [Neocloeon triangulifer]
MTDYVTDVAHHYGADPELTSRIINQMKSKGYFDQLRKEILADIDTKPAYQNMRQRVENAVNRYLKNQKWNPDLVKNKLRDTLRRHLIDGRFIHIGPVLNQVLTPDVCSLIAPEVDKEICKELGIPEDEETVESDSPNQRRRDGDFGGQGGSFNGFGDNQSPYGGGRHNGRAWRQDSDYFYPYRGGYNRFSRRGGYDSSSDDENSDRKNEKQPPPKTDQFDDLDFEYSKEEAVELERKENPKEAAKWALQQLAMQKIKIEEELRRIEREEQMQAEQRRLEAEEQLKIEAEKQKEAEILEQQRAQQAEVEAEKVKEMEVEAPQIVEMVQEEELEEPKTPEMSDGEDSDAPEMQIVEEDSLDKKENSQEATPVAVAEESQITSPVEDLPKAIEEEVAPAEVKIEEVQTAEKAVVESETKKPETESKPEPEKIPDVKKEDFPAPKRELLKSKSVDESQRGKDERRKEYSSSSSSSRRLSSSKSSSSHKSSSSSSKTDSSRSSHSKSRDERKSSSSSSSHRSSSKRDSDRHRSRSSSSSNHRKDSRHGHSSRSSSHRRGEDSNNLYYFTAEQSIDAVKSRIHLDEVMIRLEAENSGYDSLLSESESEEAPQEDGFDILIENSEALTVEEVLDIEISGVERDISSDVQLMNEINDNTIMASPKIKINLKRDFLSNSWNHKQEMANDKDDYLEKEVQHNKVLTVVVEKCFDQRNNVVNDTSMTPPDHSVAPPKRKRIVRKIEQRYSTDDLYKPRATFTSSRRSRE